MNNKFLSIVVPVYNESDGIDDFNSQLLKCLDDIKQDYEVIYCDDGSSDATNQIIANFAESNHKIKLVTLSRNFGKEAALTAGIAASTGQAVIMLDADGQHPIECIPEFISKWQAGAQVVVGLGQGGQKSGFIKDLSSKFFYKTLKFLTGQNLAEGSSDFRLIDADVRKAFLSLNENNRLTRGLIDWLGFKRDFVRYEYLARNHGQASYSYKKLTRLAIDSITSLTPKPLYIFGYIGLAITPLSLGLGLCVIFEQFILDDPLNWNFTGPAMLGILTIFLIGLVLMAIGILSLYVAKMQNQSRGRPLYVVDESRSSRR